MSALSGQTVPVALAGSTIRADMYAWATLMVGLTSTGLLVPARFNSDGTFSATVTGGGDASAANQLAGIYGATNLVTSQVTSGAAATLVAARPTRRSVFIRNNGTSTDEVAVGEATVTTTKGTRLKAGEGLSFTFTGLIQVLAITGTPIVTAADEFN